MPKTPITDRTMLYDVLRYDKTIRFLDWNVVETELGTMVEPRPFGPGYGTVKVTDVDVYDASANRLVQYDENTFAREYGTGGNQLPADFSPQGA